MFSEVLAVSKNQPIRVIYFADSLRSRFNMFNRERKVSAPPKRHDGAGHTNLSRATGRSSTARHLSTAEIGLVCQGLKTQGDDTTNLYGILCDFLLIAVSLLQEYLFSGVNEGDMADHTPPLESGQLLSPELSMLASPLPPAMVNGDGPQQVL